MESHSTSNLAVDLGTVEYSYCHSIQRNLVSLRKEGRVGNTILFCDHDPPVYTIGRKAERSNYSGVDVIEVERGGDVTYHCKDQIVAYYVFSVMREGRRDVGLLIRSVEQSVIDALEDQGIHAYRGSEPGIWVSGRKVCSIGLAIDGEVSFHGSALNTSEAAMNGFYRINPCGLSPSVMGWVSVDRKLYIQSVIRSLGPMYGPFRLVDREEFLQGLGLSPLPS
ncbi:hypothetical protein GCM10007108_03470 [Thermogymnomonas acidicola]|uniref:lipoyl(octanoyl) transferase n=1 Tax=Thermogymnomonas acidicola TaxID=399579 RepID=A0AA37BQ78_9ARCH|nr:lipoyl(octanoyl) transferase LipB [Thermogymnomonas acidicola]GGM68678.1 hypothetical protein GCM10007108_03470 [Thermogymnomonas acidicola]